MMNSARPGEATVGPPTTQYAQAGDINIGYQVVGDGPVDLAFVWGLASNIEVMWEEPSFAAFLRRLAEFSRLILFDRRGCGVSDRGGDTITPTLEERMDDILAVLDAVGSEQTALLGVSEGGNLAALFTATYPDRTSRLVLYATIARFRRDTEHPWGLHDKEELDLFHQMMREGWGLRTGAELSAQLWAPTLAADERFVDWMAKSARQSLSRSAIWPVLQSFTAYDVVDVFPAVRVPTLVLHRSDDVLIPVTQSRWIAQQVPDVHLVELAGVDHLPFAGDAEALADEVEDFLVGSRTTQMRDRRLLTILFTDIVDSTGQLTSLGDHAWRQLLAAHDREVDAHLDRFDGRAVKRLGDGVLAVFEGPARAIRCAQGIVEAAGRLGLSLRVGLHCGECELTDGDVHGIAVHVAGRIVERAAPGQVLVSRTVRDLVAGSGIRFGKPSVIELEGFAEPHTVLPVITHGVTPEEVRRLTIDQTNALRRDSEYWTVAYDGQVVTMRDSKGLRDVARLLASPRQEVHVLDLVAEGQVGASTVSAGQAREADLHLDDGSADPVLDEAARAAYKQRITELEQAADETEARGDGEARARAVEERDVLVAELAAAFGLGGRPRRAPDEVERARKRVSRRIRDALRRIDNEHPALGRHLHTALRTGVFCSYQPERDIAWTVDAMPSS